MRIRHAATQARVRAAGLQAKLVLPCECCPPTREARARQSSREFSMARRALTREKQPSAIIGCVRRPSTDTAAAGRDGSRRFFRHGARCCVKRLSLLVVFLSGLLPLIAL